MIFVIPLTWLLFAITDFHKLGIYFLRLVPFIPQKAHTVFEGDFAKNWDIYGKFLIAGLIFSTPIPAMIYRKIKNSPITVLALLAVFWGSVYCMYKGMNDPFMYFRF